jgi:TonB family protein
MSRAIAVLALSTLLAVSTVWPVVAQGAAQAQSETDLRTRITQQPGEPGAYLDLAKLYLEQGRFDEAARMISNALALTRRQIPAGSTATSSLAPSSLSSRYPDALRVGGDIREPRKLADVKPVYPAVAQAANVQGIVILEALINQEGNVADVVVLRSVQLLDAAAVEAVQQWQYTPTLLNGSPVDVIMTVTVNFSLSQ